MNSPLLEVMRNVFAFSCMKRIRSYVVFKEDGTLVMRYLVTLHNRRRSFSPFRLSRRITGLYCVMICKDLWRVYSMNGMLIVSDRVWKTLRQEMIGGSDCEVAQRILIKLGG